MIAAITYLFQLGGTIRSISKYNVDNISRMSLQNHKHFKIKPALFLTLQMRN